MSTTDDICREAWYKLRYDGWQEPLHADFVVPIRLVVKLDRQPGHATRPVARFDWVYWVIKIAVLPFPREVLYPDSQGMNGAYRNP